MECELRMGRKVAGATFLIEVDTHDKQQEKSWQTEQQGRLASEWGCFDTDLKKASQITMKSLLQGERNALLAFTGLDYRKLFTENHAG